MIDCEQHPHITTLAYKTWPVMFKPACNSSSWPRDLLCGFMRVSIVNPTLLLLTNCNEGNCDLAAAGLLQAVGPGWRTALVTRW
jgi:hypothetical protein